MASRTHAGSNGPGRTVPTTRRRRSPWIRRLKLALVFALIIFLAGFCTVFLMFMGAIKAAQEQMPTLESKFDQVYRPASRILTADGVELFRESPENRIPLKFAEIPVHVRQAILAAEDKRFYEHNGVDGEGLARAFWNLFRSGHISGGGSTITMQLAKRLYNGNAVSFRRKMQDIAFAYEIERTVANKNRILELYMNQVYFGEGAYGIGAAARIYLNKKVSELTISEAALLARCVRMPNRQNPIRSYRVAIENRNVVLGTMRSESMISDAEYAKALNEEPKVNKRPPRTTAYYTAGYGQHFVRQVLDYLETDAPGIDFKGGGVTVYTTLDSHLQRRAEHTVRAIVAENHAMKVNQGAFVAMDHDGKILCEVGGVDFLKDQWNIITQSKLQPGSGFKPFLYATALKEGTISLNESLSNAPISIKDGNHMWEPKNSSPRENQPFYSLASALAQSVNRPAIHTILKVGPQTVVQYAHDFFGFRSPISAYPSLAIGACRVGPLEVLEGYSVFAFRGTRVRPYPITRIVGADGQVIKEYYPQKFEDAFDPAICDEMDGLLRGVVEFGTGRSAAVVPDARGKTGTTNDAKDAWFNGYTDGVVGVAWVGNERRINGKPFQLPMGSAVYGGTTAVLIWRDVMSEARERFGIRPEPSPTRVATVAPHDKQKDALPAKSADPIPADQTDPISATGTDAGYPDAASTTAGAPDPKTAAGAMPTDSVAPKKETGANPPVSDIDNPAVGKTAPPPSPVAPSKPVAKTKPQEMIAVEVCADTGDLATPYCPETVKRSFPVGKQPRKYCSVHRPPH